MPPLFAEYEDELSNAEMCFKIPRKIDRCDANPEMNLYDLVVGIFKKEIMVLERKTRDGEEYAELDRIESDRITSLCKYDCLLRGSLTIHTVERSIILSYNTVSESIINDAVNLIRKIQPQKRVAPVFENLNYNFETMEFRFVNIVNRIIQEDDSLHLIAYQPSLFSKIPREFDWEFLMRFGLTEKALSSFVLMSNSKELLIVHRHYFLKRKSTDSYARYFYYIPFDSINEIKTMTQSNGISGVKLQTKHLNLFLKADIENEELNSIIRDISNSNLKLEVQF